MSYGILVCGQDCVHFNTDPVSSLHPKRKMDTNEMKWDRRFSLSFDTIMATISSQLFALYLDSLYQVYCGLLYYKRKTYI